MGIPFFHAIQYIYFGLVFLRKLQFLLVYVGLFNGLYQKKLINL